MTIEQLTKELDEMNAARAERKEEAAKIASEFPPTVRTFTYRKSPAITSRDVCSL